MMTDGAAARLRVFRAGVLRSSWTSFSGGKAERIVVIPFNISIQPEVTFLATVAL
jgi:hypothetical protein